MRIAIIDIGSNAVRCVVYSDSQIGGYEVYHEKFKLDANNLVVGGKINTKHSFYSIIKRFLDMVNKLKVGQIKCVATATFRDNPESQELCDDFFQKFGINIEVISGKQEAFLSSCGLLMGSANCRGIIADLGGGSLEIAEVKSHKITKLTSLALGTRILSQIENLNVDYITEQIKTNASDLISNNIIKGKLYLIGGGFRVIAREYIKHTRYPLYNLHNLEISKEDLLDYIKYLNTSSTHIFGISRKNDSFATLVLQSLINIFEPDLIAISNYGLKEGVRFTSIPQEERYKDVIFERCKRFIRYEDDSIDLEGYSSLVSEALIASQDEIYDFNDIVKLSLMFLYFKKYVDRNFLSSFLSSTILMIDIPFTHKQRASLGLILANSFGGKPSKYISNLADKILGSKFRQNSLIIAYMINILLILDGPELSSKCEISLTIKDNKLAFTMPNTLPYSLYSCINKELKLIEQIRKNLLTIS